MCAATNMDMDRIMNAVIGMGPMMDTDLKLYIDTNMDIEKQVYRRLCFLSKRLWSNQHKINE